MACMPPLDQLPYTVIVPSAVFSAVELSCADMPQEPTWFVLMEPEFVTEDWSVASMPFELK